MYWTGDTIYCDDVKKVITIHKPDYIITHSCGATLDDSGPIIMDAEQTIELCKDTGDAVIIAVHMEALDHATVTRNNLRNLADKESISREKLLIPEDGQTIG